MEQDDELAEYGSFLRGIIESPMKPDWKRAAEAIGITRTEADAIGITPFDLTEEADAAVFVEGTVTGMPSFTEAYDEGGA